MTTLTTDTNEPLHCPLSYAECKRELSSLRYKEVIPIDLLPAVMQPGLMAWLRARSIEVKNPVSNYNYCEWYYQMLDRGAGYPIQFRVD